MRKLVLYILTLFVSMSASAQILAPMGQGLPAAPDKITEYGDGLIVAYDDRENHIHITVWNGHFWNALPDPQLPNTSSEFQIIDLIVYDGGVYLAVGHSEQQNGSENIVLKWQNNQWTDLTNDIIRNSVTLNKLFVENDKVKCVGMFKTASGNYNIASLSPSEDWIAEGNLITPNFKYDNFKTLEYAQNKLLVTGSFTNPLSTKASLAEWDGRRWKVSDLPPFLGENISLGQFNENVVVYGKSSFASDPVKINTGGNWQNMSEGLENFEITNISQFAQIRGSLIAVGDFKLKSSNSISNILIYDGKEWRSTNLNLSDIEQVYSKNKEVYISGDFSDNSRINGIGTIHLDRAQITARVYNDKNGNCLKDNDEQWLANYPINVEGKELSFYTDLTGQLYLPVNKGNYSINASTDNYFQPTCPSLNIAVDEYQTYYGAALGVKRVANVYDVNVSLTDVYSYSASANEVKKAQICADNYGSRFISNGQLKLELSEGIIDFKSEIPYDSYDGEVAIWRLDLDVDESLCFDIEYIISDKNNMELRAEVALAEGIEDSELTNNTSEIKYKKGTTEDNHKECASGKTISKGTDNIAYKIGFTNKTENTVTDVKVIDFLDPLLAITSDGLVYNTSHNENAFTYVELVLTEDDKYQHKVITTLKDVSIENWENQESKSKGFVDYEINIAPVVEGDIICNQALIYLSSDGGFYSEPIVTNTVCTNVGEVLSNDDIKTNNSSQSTQLRDLEIGPNPVSNILVLDNKGSRDYHLQILNALGQSVETIELSKFEEYSLDVSNYSKGVYFIFSEGQFAQKIVVK